ncbi:MAG TPA: type I 3-dehydroquinate dehydratase [Candidatus Blautia excrementipullorum]|nr:type I 3-dehydroquinate dehydratase [Candidatus Blautia excrementipullorum]
MTKPIIVKNLSIGDGQPKICVPLTGGTCEELYQEAKRAKEARADLIEWRADCFDGLPDKEKVTGTLKEIVGILSDTPLLFTIRTEAEGGKAKLDQEKYAALNLEAAKSGSADLIDVEVFSQENSAKLIEDLQTAGARVIASSHDFQKTDNRETLLKRFQEMDKSGADILKMAVMPEEFDDVAAIMQVTSEMVHKYTDKPVISMAMGGLGSISRIAGENFGSAVTFAAVGAASAPGQFPIQELRAMMEALHKKNKAE